MARYINILSAVWTDTGNSPAPTNVQTQFLGVQSMTVNDGASLLKSAGDGDIGPSQVSLNSIEPMIGLKFEDLSPLAVQGYSGRPGKLVVQVGKAGSTAGGSVVGGLTFTLNPAVCLVKNLSANYRKEADADIEFHGVCNAGNPLSVVQTTATP